MAESQKLKLKFDTMSGSATWTFNNARVSATAAQVKALGQAMITNGEIYQKQPVRLVSAVIVTTTESSYDLS